MALSAWPSINYKPQRGTWQITSLALPPLSSDMNAGTTRRRQKYTLRITQMQFSLELKSSEFATFLTFYNSTLGCGSAQFTMSVWNGSAYVSRTVAFQKDKAPSVEEKAVGVMLVTLALDVENL